MLLTFSRYLAKTKADGPRLVRIYNNATGRTHLVSAKHIAKLLDKAGACVYSYWRMRFVHSIDAFMSRQLQIDPLSMVLSDKQYNTLISIGIPMVGKPRER